MIKADLLLGCNNTEKEGINWTH